jgi:hypothetical protein
MDLDGFPPDVPPRAVPKRSSPKQRRADTIDRIGGRSDRLDLPRPSSARLLLTTGRDPGLHGPWGLKWVMGSGSQTRTPTRRSGEAGCHRAKARRSRHGRALAPDGARPVPWSTAVTRPNRSTEQPQPLPHLRSHPRDSVMSRPCVKWLCLFSLFLISSALSAPEPDRSLSHAHPLDRALTERIRAVAAAAVAQGVVRRVEVAVYDLATGRRTGLNPNQRFGPASEIKPAVMGAAFRQRLHMPPDQFDRLRLDLERMITVSDNAATRRLVQRFGVRQVNADVRVLGIARFRVGGSGSAKSVLQGSRASPAATAFLLARIARREVVSRQAFIPAGLPFAPDLWVDNKTGTLVGVVNDAGIVLQPSRGAG